MLTGEGARVWAKDHQIEEADDDYLKTGNNHFLSSYLNIFVFFLF
jgi:hypothetical protein